VRVVEDRTAFIEQLGVPIPDKRTEKLRRRVAETKIQALQVLAEMRVASDLLRDLTARSPDEASRDTAALRSRLRTLGRKAARKRARLEALEDDLRERELRARQAVTFRLHSAAHYLDLSEEQFVQLSTAQHTSPTRVLKSAGRQWWWYRHRFWWSDPDLRPSQVASTILEHDLDSGLERHLLEEARDVTFRGVGQTGARERLPDEVRRTVWRRDAGRCVDCGSAVAVRFDYDGSIAEPTSDDVRLRCRACSNLRVQRGGRGGVTRPWGASSR
jgi:hypothetical protein